MWEFHKAAPWPEEAAGQEAYAEALQPAEWILMSASFLAALFQTGEGAEGHVFTTPWGLHAYWLRRTHDAVILAREAPTDVLYIEAALEALPRTSKATFRFDQRPTSPDGARNEQCMTLAISHCGRPSELKSWRDWSKACATYLRPASQELGSALAQAFGRAAKAAESQDQLGRAPIAAARGLGSLPVTPQKSRKKLASKAPRFLSGGGRPRQEKEKQIFYGSPAQGSPVDKRLAKSSGSPSPTP